MATPEPTTPRRRGVLDLWRAALLAVVLVVVVAETYLSTHADVSERSSESTTLLMSVSSEARTLYFLDWVSRAGRTPANVDKQRKTLLSDARKLGQVSQSPANVRRAAIVLYAFGDPDWKAALLRLRSMPTARPLDVERELALWRLGFEGHPNAAQASQISRQVERLRLGWAGHIALAAIYRNAGLSSQASAEENAAVLAAGLLMAWMWLIMGAGFLGVVLGTVAVVWLSTRRKHTTPLPRGLRPDPPPPLAAPKANVLYLAFVVYLATFVALRVPVALVIRPWLEHRAGGASLAMVFSALLAVVQIAVPLLLIWLLGRRVGLRAADFGWRSSRPLVDIVWGLGGYLVGLPLLFAVVLLSHAVQKLFPGVNTPVNPAVTQFAAAPSVLLKVLVLFEAAALAPFAEETMFRGVFFRALSARMSNVAALLVASGVFAILHPQLPLGFLAIFVLGAVFNTLYLVRGSLLPGMVAHGVNNAGIVILLTLTVGT